jgi:hypothetical protein
MEIKFSAITKQFKVRSLVSGDKEGELLLRFRIDSKLFKDIADVYESDQEVVVTVSNGQ